MITFFRYIKRRDAMDHNKFDMVLEGILILSKLVQKLKLKIGKEWQTYWEP